LKESLSNCAAREVDEETGLKIEEFEYVGVVRELQEDSNFIHFAFVAKAIKETPENREPNKCVGWEWYSLDRLPENVMPGHLAAISMFKNKTTLVDLNNA
jgi:8-oxo-dGTP diphosphatase